MNPNALNLSWAVFSPVYKKYLLGYASAGSNVPDKAICYDMIQKRYTLWDHLPGGWATTFRFSQSEAVVMGDNTLGNVYQLFSGYADIAGYNSTVTSATSTTLTDSSASWTTDQFVDARVQVFSSGTVVTQGVVTANDATTLTVSGFTSTPTNNAPYSIGGYAAYWKTKVFDLGAPDMRKRYKYWDLFTDSEANYSLLVGASIDFAPLSFNLQSLSLSSGGVLWDQLGVAWDQAGVTWDQRASLYKRAGLPGQGRYIQSMFGTVGANMPWRVFEHSYLYKLKKASPSTT